MCRQDIFSIFNTVGPSSITTANTTHWLNVVLRLSHRLRRWPNSKTTLILHNTIIRLTIRPTPYILFIVILQWFVSLGYIIHIYYIVVVMSEQILVFIAFCTITAISRQKEAWSRDFVLLLSNDFKGSLWCTVHRHHHTINTCEQCALAAQRLIRCIYAALVTQRVILCIYAVLAAQRLIRCIYAALATQRLIRCIYAALATQRLIRCIYAALATQRVIRCIYAVLAAQRLIRCIYAALATQRLIRCIYAALATQRLIRCIYAALATQS